MLGFMFLLKEVSDQRVSVQGGSLTRGSLSRGSLSRGSLSGGSLSSGVSVWEGSLSGRHPAAVWLCAGGTLPTGMHSCYHELSLAGGWVSPPDVTSKGYSTEEVGISEGYSNYPMMHVIHPDRNNRHL